MFEYSLILQHPDGREESSHYRGSEPLTDGSYFTRADDDDTTWLVIGTERRTDERMPSRTFSRLLCVPSEPPA